MSDEEVRALYEEYKSSGMGDVFYREFRNIPISLDEQGFREEYFRYYDETEDQLNRDPDVITVILCDPAKTMAKGSCDTALAAVSVNTRKQRIYVREVVEGRMTPAETYDQMFDMAKRNNAMILAPEVTGLNEYILYPLKTEMGKRGLFYVIVEVKPREGKTGPRRSGGLIPLYRRGEVLHNKNTCGALQRRLLQWPRPDKWDTIDAVSGILFVMEEGERYFEAPDGQDPEADYKDMEYEPALNMREFALM